MNNILNVLYVMCYFDNSSFNKKVHKTIIYIIVTDY